MSNTIGARYQRARKATPFQQQPSALIDTDESRAVFDTHCSARTYYGSGRIIGVIGAGTMSSLSSPASGSCSSSIIGWIQGPRSATGLTRMILPIDDDYPTGGLAIVHGEAIDIWTRWAEITKALFKQAEAGAKSAPSAAGNLRAGRLAAIQAALGLPTQALAEVLRISRPGLYKWFDASKDITLQEASRQRLATVERWAKLWRERSNAPLNSVAHEALAGGRTVLEMLTDDGLDEAAVIGAFDELADKLRDKPKSLSQKMGEAGFTRRPSGRSLPDDD